MHIIADIENWPLNSDLAFSKGHKIQQYPLKVWTNNHKDFDPTKSLHISLADSPLYYFNVQHAHLGRHRLVILNNWKLMRQTHVYLKHPFCLTFINLN